MGKIIQFSKDYKKSLYSTIIKELENSKVRKYSFSDITNYANRILEASREFNPYKCETLIVKIAGQFGIKVYQEKMKTMLGCIKINGNTKEDYAGNEKVILVDTNIDNYLKRFITAYELGCYLFNYLGSDIQQNREYFYAKCISIDSKAVAYRFAMDILMPSKLFIEQYNIAVKEDNSYIFVLIYLSKYFAVPEVLVKRRIREIECSQK